MSCKGTRAFPRIGVFAVRFVVPILLIGVCVGCAADEQWAQAGRPGVYCLPPRTPVDALASGLYTLCAEYRAGRIDGRQYASALQGFQGMLVALTALDALEARDRPRVDEARAAIISRLRHSATLRTLCFAPSAATHGRLVECAWLEESRGS
jgi:hypothetical protein